MTTRAPYLLEVRDLHVVFSGRRGTGSLRAVDGVSLHVDAAETLGLVGESGSGKTTLARVILSLLRPTSGSVLFDGIDINELSRRERRDVRRRAQMVFQDPFGSLNPRQTIGRTIATPTRIHNLRPRELVRGRVEELLELVGLSASDADKYPHEFSGGQRQRIGIARALSVEPSFLICDEPVSALDVSIQAQILNLLLDLRRELGVTYILISHDLSVVRQLSDRVAVMYLGRIVETGTSDEVYQSPRHPYTRTLLSAVAVPDPKLERSRQRIMLNGDPPSPYMPPSGCRFHSRCPLYREMGEPERCRTEDPALGSLDTSTHSVACHFPLLDERVSIDVSPTATFAGTARLEPG